MQREKATALGCVVVGEAAVEEATLATPGEPPLPQPAVRSETAATDMTEIMMTGRQQHNPMGMTVERPSLRRVARERCLSATAQR